MVIIFINTLLWQTARRNRSLTVPTSPAPTDLRQEPPLKRPSVLRDTAFLRLWSGTTASGLATWALPFVLGLAVLDRSLTPAGLGLVLAARTAGFLVAVAVGGVLADRHSAAPSCCGRPSPPRSRPRCSPRDSGAHCR